MIKYFPFLDIGPLREINVSRTTQLFFVFLVAHFYETQRVRGRHYQQNIEFDNDNQSWAKIRSVISNGEIKKNLGFCPDLILKTQNEIKIKMPVISFKFKRVKKWPQRYRRYRDFRWAIKYRDDEFEYSFRIKDSKLNISLPSKIIYDNNLSYTEKLALVWNEILCKRFNKQPTLKIIEENSGISERTIRKAKKKFPALFEKRRKIK